MEGLEALGAIAQTYLLGMIFFGMIFTFEEIANRVEPRNRMLLVLGLIFINLMTAGLVFLCIGIWGAAFKTTEAQKRKKK
jgi:hypothetical protein